MVPTFSSKDMFTGLIEALGEVANVTAIPAGLHLRVAAGLAAELAPGDSVAVNGVCLTVAQQDALGFDAELAPETTRVTTLGGVRKGTVVNLERPLRADARVGGHFVLGHVDDMGQVDGIQQQSDFYRVTFRYPAALTRLIVEKGSIAVDGVSLTVAGLGSDRFDVQMVPYTWEHTTFHGVRVHDLVNLECDIIGRYVVRSLEAGRSGGIAGTAD